MSEASRLNHMITTITFQVLLKPVTERDRDMVELDGELVYRAVEDVLRRNPHIERTPSKFKNCVIIKVPTTSSRGVERTIAVKVFKNLSLHVTGCHSSEMIAATVESMRSELSQSLPLTGQLTADKTTVTMVNYSHYLPGKVQLQALCDYLTHEHKMLVIFDPSKYAGANIKFPFASSSSEQTDDGKRARVESKILVSIMIFETGKIIISTPKCEQRDELLAHVINFIERSIAQRWHQLRLQ